MKPAVPDHLAAALALPVDVLALDRRDLLDPAAGEPEDIALAVLGQGALAQALRDLVLRLVDPGHSRRRGAGRQKQGAAQDDGGGQGRAWRRRSKGWA